MKNKIWFITGISSGLGKALSENVIQNGDFVIGTFRNQYQVDAFNTQYKNKAFAICLDIKKAEQINDAVDLIKQKFGTIDVLVNNAGFGLAGAIEETSDEETRSIFESNFFGTLKVTQKILPLMREQKSGHIIQISSHGGFKAFAGFGIYNASKFALEGFSEALEQEISQLGIKLTIVQPGPFRTNFAGNNFSLAKNKIDDYNSTSGVFRERIKGVDGKQEGNPTKAAQAIFNLVQLEHPPLRLILGKIALATITSKLESVQKDLNNYKEVAINMCYS